jgi:hypothetical protein
MMFSTFATLERNQLLVLALGSQPIDQIPCRLGCLIQGSGVVHVRFVQARVGCSCYLLVIEVVGHPHCRHFRCDGVGSDFIVRRDLSD